jgi:hypothetical protein
MRRSEANAFSLSGVNGKPSGPLTAKRFRKAVQALRNGGRGDELVSEKKSFVNRNLKRLGATAKGPMGPGDVARMFVAASERQGYAMVPGTVKVRAGAEPGEVVVTAIFVYVKNLPKVVRETVKRIRLPRDTIKLPGAWLSGKPVGGA